MKKRAQEFTENVQNVIPAQRMCEELLHQDNRILPGAIVYFEDVIEIGGVDIVQLPGQPVGHLTYLPLSYAQYITFGSHGLELKDVPEQLAIALAGPESENIGDIYDIP